MAFSLQSCKEDEIENVGHLASMFNGNSSGNSCGFLLEPRIVVLTDIAPTDIEPDDMTSYRRVIIRPKR